MKDSCNNSPPSSGKYLILASTNRNKFFEIRTALGHTAIPLYSLADFPAVAEAPETGETFAQNAVQKAQYYFRHFHKPVLAEDSGLVIPALRGFPGVNSARIAPDDPSRIAIVLERMREHPAERQAYYVCSVVVLWDGEPIAAEGRCDGVLTEEPDGDLGFGYDPIFIPEGHRKTFGRMSIKEKSQYSHRGRAIHALLPRLLEMFRNWKA
jgi:XTP/dITP diphosphohydrolase